MRSVTRLAVVAALLLSGAALHAQKPKERTDQKPKEALDQKPKALTSRGKSKESPSDQKFKEPPPPERSKPPKDLAPMSSRDLFEALYPPELVMKHQNELGLGESERQALRQAVQQAQAKFTDLQWRLSAETERLGTIIREPVVDERGVLEQVDQVLALERELKRTQIALLVRIKNTLTPAQQAKLALLRRTKS
jgi:Spy/CpxP family protein refolding chaperone